MEVYFWFSDDVDAEPLPVDEASETRLKVMRRNRINFLVTERLRKMVTHNAFVRASSKLADS